MFFLSRVVLAALLGTVVLSEGEDASVCFVFRADGASNETALDESMRGALTYQLGDPTTVGWQAESVRMATVQNTILGKHCIHLPAEAAPQVEETLEDAFFLEHWSLLYKGETQAVITIAISDIETELPTSPTLDPTSDPTPFPANSPNSPPTPQPVPATGNATPQNTGPSFLENNFTIIAVIVLTFFLGVILCVGTRGTLCRRASTKDEEDNVMEITSNATTGDLIDRLTKGYKIPAMIYAKGYSHGIRKIGSPSVGGPGSAEDFELFESIPASQWPPDRGTNEPEYDDPQPYRPPTHHYKYRRSREYDQNHPLSSGRAVSPNVMSTGRYSAAASPAPSGLQTGRSTGRALRKATTRSLYSATTPSLAGPLTPATEASVVFDPEPLAEKIPPVPTEPSLRPTVTATVRSVISEEDGQTPSAPGGSLRGSPRRRTFPRRREASRGRSVGSSRLFPPGPFTSHHERTRTPTAPLVPVTPPSFHGGASAPRSVGGISEFEEKMDSVQAVRRSRPNNSFSSVADLQNAHHRRQTTTIVVPEEQEVSLSADHWPDLPKEHARSVIVSPQLAAGAEPDSHVDHDDSEIRNRRAGDAAGVLSPPSDDESQGASTVVTRVI